MANERWPDWKGLREALPPAGKDGSPTAKGFFPDPLGGETRRWWDGTKWTGFLEDESDSPVLPNERVGRSTALVDEASTVKLIGSGIALVGWIGLVGSVIGGFALWSDLSSDAFDAVEYTTGQKLEIVFGSVVLSVLGSLLVLGFGHGLRLLALHIGSQHAGPEG